MNTSSHIEAEQELFVDEKPQVRVTDYYNKYQEDVPKITSYIDYGGHVVYQISNETIYWSTNTTIA